METKAITIRVSPEAASAYERAPAEQQRKLDVLLRGCEKIVCLVSLETS